MQTVQGCPAAAYEGAIEFDFIFRVASGQGVVSLFAVVWSVGPCPAIQVKPSAPGSPPGLQTPRTASKGLSRGPSYLWSPKSLSSKRRQDVEDSDTSVHETEGDSLDVDEDADAIPVVSNMAKRYSQPSPTVVSSVSTGEHIFPGRLLTTEKHIFCVALTTIVHAHFLLGMLW